MRIRVTTALLLALPVAACSTTKVSSMSAPGAIQRTAAYRTYAWEPQPENRDASHHPLVEEHVKQAVDRDLSAKGYRKVDVSANPDFLVGWHASMQQKTEVEDINRYYGYGWDPRFGPVGVGGVGAMGPDVYVRQYQQGSIILDIVDGASNQLVWRGSAQADLGSNPQGKDIEKKIDQASKKILEKFPPKE